MCWLAEEKRNGRRLASEAEALREWVRLHKTQLQKLQERSSNRVRLKKITPRLAELKGALAEWDEDSPPEVRQHYWSIRSRTADTPPRHP